MKKRIVLLAGLLALSIVGQVLLRPCLGDNAGNVNVVTADSLEQQKVGDLTNTRDLLSRAQDDDKSSHLQSQLVKQLFLMIGFVAILGVGAWFFTKKLSSNWTSKRSKHINVTETVNLGPRKLLHIVQVGSKQYLLASTNENIRLLSDVTDTFEKAEA